MPVAFDPIEDLDTDALYDYIIYMPLLCCKDCGIQDIIMNQLIHQCTRARKNNYQTILGLMEKWLEVDGLQVGLPVICQDIA